MCTATRLLVKEHSCMMNSNGKIQIAYWTALNVQVRERGTGSGIFRESFVNFLSNDKDVDFKMVGLYSADASSGPLKVLAKLLRDIWNLIKEKSNVLVLPYPGIPLVPLTSNIKFPFAFFAYTLLWMKIRLTGQKLILLIMDLPIEQAKGLKYLIVPVNTGFYNIFEKFLFRVATRIVPFSEEFISVILAKHRISRDKLILCPRYPYIPLVDNGKDFKLPSYDYKIKIFYGGDLRRQTEICNLKKVFTVLKDFPDAALYISGMGGEWINDIGISNLFYIGKLDYTEFDLAAKQCDFAIIVYPNAPYYSLTPTAKYSAYVACGLAVLSTDSTALAHCIEEDGVGKAVPIEQLPAELSNWIQNPALFEGYKKRATELMPDFRSGKHIRQCFDQIKLLVRKRK